MVMKPYGKLLGREYGIKTVLTVFRDVALAIEYANRNGILHHDISFGNIILHEDQGYLIDWATASDAGYTSDHPLTMTLLFASVAVRSFFLNCRFCILPAVTISWSSYLPGHETISRWKDVISHHGRYLLYHQG